MLFDTAPVGELAPQVEHPAPHPDGSPGDAARAAGRVIMTGFITG
jgi:hypothetical protein